jgi:hypothetical protein
LFDRVDPFEYNAPERLDILDIRGVRFSGGPRIDDIRLKPDATGNGEGGGVCAEESSHWR